MSQYIRSRANAGFMLIELLVALAVVGVTLAAIGAVVAGTVHGSRAIQDRLAASAIAETLLAGLTNRAAVRLGRSTGETSGYRWVMDVAAMKQGDGQAGNWQPCGVTIEVGAGRGALVQLASVVLVRRATP